MADIHPDITPTGLSQKHLIDLLYMFISSLQGICAKLDDDGGVPLETYEANCYTALINTIITDSKGNRTGLIGTYIVSPTGISDTALVSTLYDIFNAFETLAEQLDADTLTDSTYEALCYTVKFLGNVTAHNNTLGNGTAYYFGPARPGEGELIDLLYNITDAFETLTEQLDNDGTVTDANYEALWFTANITLKIKNSTGDLVGN